MHYRVEAMDMNVTPKAMIIYKGIDNVANYFR